MPYGVLNITYQAQGDTVRTYTFGVKETRNNSGAGAPDALMWANLMGPRIANNLYGNTIPTPGTGPIAGMSLLESILNLLRGLMPPAVSILKAHLNDGKTPGIDTGPFGTDVMNLQCNWAYNIGPAPAADTLAPANVTVYVSKTPALFNVNPGKQFLRFCLLDEWVTYGPGGGAKLDNAMYRDNVNLALQTATYQSGLSAFFAGKTTGAGVMFFGQLQGYTVAEIEQNEALRGAYKAVQAIRAWDAIDAWGRQTGRGKKRKLTPGQIAREAAAYGLVIDPNQMRTNRLAQRASQNSGIVPAYNAQGDDPENLADARPIEQVIDYGQSTGMDDIFIEAVP